MPSRWKNGGRGKLYDMRDKPFQTLVPQRMQSGSLRAVEYLSKTNDSYAD